ncbi:MAG: ATP-binding cassette domain-containing protein [Myxococcaceae bacterium]
MKKCIIILSLCFSIGASAQWEAPVAGAVAGFQIGGATGAAAGLLVGCADEIFVSNGFYDKHYLASGALGVGLLQPMALPYHISEGIGFLAGLLLSTGHLTPWLDTLTGPAMNGLMGASLMGPAGAVGGLVCSGVDTFLMKQNWTDKPYLEKTLQGISGANVLGLQFGFSAPIRLSAGIGLSSYYLAAQDKNMHQTTALELGKKLYKVYAKLMNPKQLDQLLEQQVLVMAASNLATARLLYQLNGFDAKIDDGISQIVDKKELFFGAMKDLSIFLIPYFAIDTSSNQISKYLSSTFSAKLENKAFENYLFKEAPLKLGLDNSTQTAVSKLRENIQAVSGEGNNLLGIAFQGSTGTLFQISVLYQKQSLDLIPLSAACQAIVACVSVPLSHWHASYKLLIDEEDNKIKLYDTAANTQADLIIPYDRLDLLRNKSSQAVTKRQNLQYKQSLIGGLMGGFSRISRTAENILRYAFIGGKILSGAFKTDERYQVLVGGMAVSQAMSWGPQNAVAISQVEKQIEQISSVLEAIQKNFESNKPQLIFKTLQDTQSAIEYTNIKAGLKEGETRITIENLYLKNGIYAVTGPSGYGKSTFLKKLKGLQHSYGWAQGEVTYWTPNGESPKLTFISQKDYLMPYASLLEIILSKTEYSLEEHERVQSLAKEIELDKNDFLAQQPSWEELSGGERKKVAVISAIMQNPNILVLDETFVGLDPKSLQNTQAMLKKYLPNTLFLVVEQQLEANNRFGFYDYELRLDEGRIRDLEKH